MTSTRFLPLACLLAFLFTSLASVAQSTVNSAANVEQTVDERVRAASALKELHGELNEQLQALAKLNGQVDRIAAPRIAEIKSDIARDLERVEQGLNRVSATDANSFATVRDEAMQLIKELRASVDTRSQGLKEAFGTK